MGTYDKYAGFGRPLTQSKFDKYSSALSAGLAPSSPSPGATDNFPAELGSYKPPEADPGRRRGPLPGGVHSPARCAATRSQSRHHPCDVRADPSVNPTERETFAAWAGRYPQRAGLTGSVVEEV